MKRHLLLLKLSNHKKKELIVELSGSDKTFSKDFDSEVRQFSSVW